MFITITITITTIDIIIALIIVAPGGPEAPPTQVTARPKSSVSCSSSLPWHS